MSAASGRGRPAYRGPLAPMLTPAAVPTKTESRQGDKERGRQGDREQCGAPLPFPQSPLSLSPCLLVSLSPPLREGRGSVSEVRVAVVAAGVDLADGLLDRVGVALAGGLGELVGGLLHVVGEL